MFEVLKIIILACQISSNYASLSSADNYQKDCQKNLIKCINLKIQTSKPINLSTSVKQCLLDR